MSKLDYNHITSEIEIRILDFLNQVSTPEEISLQSQGVKDDPNHGFGDQIHDPGIGKTVAQRIIDKRDQCPNSKLTSIQQLDDIAGFGQDKLNDLVYSFSRPQKDSLKLDYTHITPEIEIRILEFLNQVSTTEEISLQCQGVKDDPNLGFGDQIHDPGIGKTVAQRIIDKRDQCPNGRFSDIKQLDDIAGFGQDKLNDLAFSFSRPEIKTPSESVDTDYPSEPVDVDEPSDIDYPSEPVDTDRPVEPGDIDEPVDVDYPSEPVDTDRPVEPDDIDYPSEPVDTDEPIDIDYPSDPVDTDRPVEPVEPGDIDYPSEPVDTDRPVEPVDVDEPLEPDDIDYPSEPVDTDRPVEPVEPIDIDYPSEPGDVDEPVDIDYPSEPVDTDEPVDIDYPSEPGDTDRPVEPVDPIDIDYPSEPVDTDRPVEPVRPDNSRSLEPNGPVGSNGHVVPATVLQKSDVGNLDKVLRKYYLTQIKSLDNRKERRQARTLIEDHLVLPESERRTTKDIYYIKEKLGVEGILLEKLEDTRLIRKFNSTTRVPIYEVSHDSLVEPILAERKDREAIVRFFKKWGRLAAVLLLLFFLSSFYSGMWFENKNNILTNKPSNDTLFLGNQFVSIDADGNPIPITLPAPQRIKTINPGDSLNINLTFHPISHGRIGTFLPDTLPIGKIPVLIDPTVLGDSQITGNGVPQDINKPIKIFGPTQTRGLNLLTTHIQGIALIKNSPTPPPTPTYPDPTQTDSPSTPTLTPLDKISIPLVRKRISAGNIGEASRTIRIDSTYILSNFYDKSKNYLLDDSEINFTYELEVVPSPPPPPAALIDVDGVNIDGFTVKLTDGREVRLNVDPTGANQRRGTTKFHTVKKGDTLFDIAKNNGLTVQQLKNLNGLTSNEIKIGQRLKLP